MEKVKNIIEEYFPDLKVVTVKSIGSGWSNTAVLVNGEYVFRISKDADEEEDRTDEISILKFLEDKLSVNIPVISHISSNKKFYGYKKIPGDTIDPSRLDGRRREDLITLWTNTSIEIENILALRDESIVLLDFSGNEHRIAQFKKVLATDILSKKQKTYVERILQTYLGLYSKSTKVPVHGDMGFGNWLYDMDNDRYSLIDWSDVCYAPQEFNMYRVAFDLPDQIEKMVSIYEAATNKKVSVPLIVACGIVSDVSIMGEKLESAQLINNKIARLDTWINHPAMQEK